MNIEKCWELVRKREVSWVRGEPMFFINEERREAERNRWVGRVGIPVISFTEKADVSKKLETRS